MTVATSVYEELAEIQGQIESLQQKAKPLMDEIKQDMIASGTGSYQAGGREFVLSSSQRNTIRDKAGLLSYLVQNGLNTLVDVEPKPNVDRMKQAVASGKMDPQVFESFVKTSVTNTFKIK